MKFSRRLAVLGCLAVVLGWSDAAAQAGCDYQPAWCGGIPFDNVERNLSTEVTVGYNQNPRCIFIAGLANNGNINYNNLSNGGMINGVSLNDLGSTYFTPQAVNAMTKMDGGYYVYLLNWSQMQNATAGSPVCTGIPVNLTINRTGTGAGTTVPAPGVHTYNAGTNVTITASPGPEIRVVWSGCSSVSPDSLTCNVTNLSGDRTVDVAFNPNVMEVPTGWLAWNTVNGNDFAPGTGGEWSSNNWSSATSAARGPWTQGSRALFAGPDGAATGSYTITAAVTNVDSMRFNATGYVIETGTGTSALTLNNGNIIIAGGKTVAINGVLAGQAGMRVNTVGAGTSRGTLNIGGSSANSYTGATFITGNTTVRVSKSGALGASAGAAGLVTVNATNARLELAGATIANNLSIGAANLFSTTGTNTLSGGVALATGTNTVEVSSALGMTGVISGSGGLTKTGAAVLTLSGNNTYTGATAVNAGSLVVGGGTAPTTGSLAGSLTIASGATATFNRSNAVTQTGLSGAGNLVKEGTGTLTLAGANTSFTGITNINAGTLSIATATAIGPATGGGAITVGTGGTLSLNGSFDFGRTVTGTGAIAKAGTGTVNLTGTGMSIGTVRVNGGTLNANYTSATGLRATDSVIVASGAVLAGTGTVEARGIRADGGTLVGSEYVGPVILSNGGAIENTGTGLMQISGSLSMGAAAGASGVNVSLTPAMKADAGRKILITGTLALGGTLNITNASISEDDIGTYRIMEAQGAITGTSFAAVTLNGMPAPGGYVFTTSVSGRFVHLSIAKASAGDIISNPLQVIGAEFVSEGPAGSVIRLTLSGINGLRSYQTGDPRVSSVYIWYRPDSRAVGPGDTIPAGGRFQVYPQTAFPATNTMEVTYTIPSSKGDLNSIYYFNAGVYWNAGGRDSLPPLSAAASVFPRNMKSMVTANPLGIAITSHTSTTAAVTFNLMVTGQHTASLTPSGTNVPYVNVVGVWIKRNGGAPAFAGNTNLLEKAAVANADNFEQHFLDDLKADAALVHSAAAVAENAIADTFYFAIAPYWTGAGVDSIARPLNYTQAVVVNPGRPMPNNPCLLTAVQQDVRVRVVNIAVGQEESFNEQAHSVRVDFSWTPGGEVFQSVPLKLTEVEAGAKFDIRNDSLVGVERLVHYEIHVLDIDGLGTTKSGSFTVGRSLPRPPVGLVAEPNGGGTMRVRWNRVTPEANNIGEETLYSRIYVAYSLSQPAANADISAMPGVKEVGIGETETIITDMEPETDYWVAAMVYDGVVPVPPQPQAWWNLKSPPVMIRTNSGSADIVPNIVEITTARFEEENANFFIRYRISELQNGVSGTMLRYFVMLGSDTVARSPNDIPLRVFQGGLTDSLRTIALEALVFDTVYHVYLYSVHPVDGPAVSRAVDAVRVGSFTRQIVYVGTSGASLESAFVDNGRMGFSVQGWSISGVTCTVTVSPSTSGSNVAGFEFLGDFGYYYTVSAGSYVSSTSGVLEPFTIMIKAEGIPVPYTADDVRIYRYSGSTWEVVYDTKYENGYFVGTGIDMVHRDMGTTYRLAISTQRPTVRNNHGTMIYGSARRQAVTIGQTILPSEETYHIQSNTANARAFMLIGPANNPTTLSRLEPDRTAAGQSIFGNIEPQMINDAGGYGLFMFLVVTDGRNTDTINVSRSIKSFSYTGFRATPEARKWVPFATQSDLDTMSAKSALNRQFFATSGEDFAAYDTLFRLFRWLPNSSNSGSNNKWVEFGSENARDDDFALTPGRLMWVKTADGTSPTMGGATTYSLVDTFTIMLPPGQWTDLVLPFTYDIALGDVLTATARDSLHFYRWKRVERGRHNYVTEQAAVARIDSTYILKGGEDPFTVYNNGRTEVILRIPPKPALMSRHRSQASRSAKVASGMGDRDLWYYSIRSSTAGSSELNEVMAGYAPTERTFPVPPSFSTEAVVLVGEDGSLMGHQFSPAVTRGGKTFRLRFYNDERQRTTFRFTAEPGVGGVPADARVAFINAVTGAVIEAGKNGVYSLAVAGSSHEDVYMVVGGREYQNKVVAPVASKFTVAGISVNQGARSVRLRYYIPMAGIDMVEVSVYDIRGRMAWKSAQRVRPNSWHTTEWNSRESRRGSVGAGMYIIRVRAIDARGKTTAVENRRIMFSR
ncbi:MAG: autotransporter-associated beta strand repeat-containing protein [Chitinispirillia bacterium]|nr:autotransporter-associated beta strand repeat-containing protein [Chitinispirillia bacterium]